MNLAFGACHAPHQVPREWIAPYIDVVAKGYDQTRADRLARQLAEGVVLPGTRLTPRHAAVKPCTEPDADRECR
jgi:arylsulfatase